MDVKIPKKISPLLQEYSDTLISELSDVIDGVYLYGSIALSAFDEHKSDIDFITIVKRSLTSAEIEIVRKLHHKLKKDNPLAKRLDGMYINLEDIGRDNKSLQPYPCCASGVFKKEGHWDINHVTWWTLKHHGITIVGKRVDDLGIATEWQDVKETMNYNINEYWAKKGKSRIYFLFDEWIEDAVVTLCRIYYTLKYQEIIAKGKAVEYALQVLSSEWHLLLKESIRIRNRENGPSYFSSRIKRAQEARNFIAYMITCCNMNFFTSDHHLEL
ncbi:aminoglycoside adenylyltransferase domain-containing protein [Brevibacillus laterosporus]|uniref:DUF4111 domain-containing protein n=1 Tax=Brevibacillus laterosporus TaxID=1465 RepID=A0AAP3GE82_BRELA|nr:aminoglycoside adenylyltransferase domain-containing protein [Brevibacillus laterosporus]MCR8983113.1 DUF4111 domain-containing protein [Brevibacillus laterosporus]MCZ0810269.1 DUF4111 domain-containing protein [Brevibacillus laterosporus]MCZ0828867.1 DUF4111 domain-containing protein [Brevibacillus laterosporus]MCZ0852888.1 DUF4111 domain-containing protein [Brevibacillus laterosporus]MED1665467.1 DUF4111 domain-containing protein [Brevibacillus laterosporus]